MSDSELKPCPFCGAEAQIALSLDDGLYVAECLRCPADVAGEDKASAIAAWNRRAPDPRVTTFLRDLVAHKFAGSLPADVVAAEAEVLLAKIEVKP